MQTSLNILLVEDSPSDARLIDTMLSRVGYNVHTASRLREALHWLETHLPDAIVLDLYLPDSDMNETLNHVKIISNGFPLIVLTGLVNEQVGLEALEAGAQDYLSKDDINHKILSRALHYAVARHHAERMEIVNQQLHKALEKEQQVSRMRRQFVNILSHELRTPLTTILTSVSMMRTFNDKMSPERRLSKINQVEEAVLKLSDLMEHLLLSAQAEEGVLILNAVKENLNSFCVRAVEQSVSVIEPGRTVYLDTTTEPIITNLDENLFANVMDNLLSNALKYSEPQTPIYIRVWQAGDEAAVSIRDEGRGIPAAELDKLFEPFYRARNVENVRGTGIGLMAVQHIVRAHGGRIEVESEVNVGTTFTVSLPLA